MSANQGRQSPSPSRQTGAQQNDPPSSGTGVNDSSDPESNKKTSEEQLENLESNPKPVLEDEVVKKFSKEGSGGEDLLRGEGENQ